MNNILYLHNGNTQVKQWFLDQYPSHCEMPCLTVPWTINGSQLNDFESKLELLKTRSNLLFDLVTADAISNLDLIELKKYCTVIKVISSLDNDLDNLEDIWTEYNKDQWLRSVVCRLWCADQVMYYKTEIKFASILCEPIVFTPGRCGTHVLKSVTGIDKFMHHDHDVLFNSNFIELANASKIFVVLRGNYLKQCLGDSLMKYIGYAMISTVENWEANKTIAENIQPFNVDESEFILSFDKLVNFLDILYALKYFWHKEIIFTVFEFFKDHFDRIATLKNPYSYEKIVANYAEVVAVNQLHYQPYYETLMAKLKADFGVKLF